MSFDGDNFNSLIDTSLKTRMFQLLRDAEPDRVDRSSLALYERTFENLFKYQPLPEEKANASHMVVVTLVGIHDRLVEVARPHRRSNAGERGDYTEWFEIEAKLDEEENEWRAAIGIAQTKSEHLDE